MHLYTSYVYAYIIRTHLHLQQLCSIRLHAPTHTYTKEGAINRVPDDGAGIEWVMMVNADICSVIILENVKRTNSKHSQGGGEL